MTAPSPTDLDFAARIPALSGLKPQQRSALLTDARVVNLRQGHVLFRQGEPATAFFIILEGWIKLYRVTLAGDEAVINVLTKGESFAEAVAFTQDHYPASASAVTGARVLIIPADHVVDCIRRTPDIAIAMVASTYQHLHRMVMRIEQLTAQSATQRVADFLLMLAPRADGPCTLELPYDKSVIAGRLGLKPESLSRVFANLRSGGVDVQSANVVVKELAVLRKLVAGDRTRGRNGGTPPRVALDPQQQGTRPDDGPSASRT